VPRKRFEEGITIADASILAGFCNSKSEVRRAIANNAISVNDNRITDFDFVLGEKDFTPEGVIKLSFGRKKHLLLKPE
jgi:tyrosyl-tRNA synthetase